MMVAWRSASLSLAVAVGASLSLAACVGQIGGEGSGQQCVPGAISIGPAPLRRLNRTEYLNTVRDLLPGVTLPALEMIPDKVVDGFENNVESQQPGPLLIEQYFEAAGAVAKTVEEQIGTVLPCAQGPASEHAACAATFVDDFGHRAYRRPLTADEKSRFTSFIATEVPTHGFVGAVGMLVHGLLQSPSFLYRPEFGVPDPSAPEARPLSGHELATRLSYYLWQTAPDGALLAAAESGALATPAGLETEARRMLADPRARAMMNDFHRQWLELDRIANMNRDEALFPAFSPELPAVMHEATEQYVDHVFWEGDGRLSSLLLEPKAYVNDALAPVYGVDPPGSSELTLVDLDPSQRAGLLTQAGLLAGMAHEKFDAPIIRGTFVLKRFLCSPPPPPPPDVPDIPPANPADKPMTTRQRVEETHRNAGCIACHENIDGVGFGFNHFDAIGQYRTEENGLPVDASGKLPVASDIAGPFYGAIELSQKLADSAEVEACVVSQYYRFGMGRSEAREDACAEASLTEAFRASGGNMRDLLLGVVLSDSFRYRRPIALEP